jgi:DNA-binding response OmpR family regulator
MTGGNTPDPATADTDTSPDAGTDTGGDQPRILVIDDEKRVGQAFALWLDDGYRVETATSGEEGLEMLTDDVDVVLLDRHMPGLSGSEVLERIREAGYDCRVAMVTAVDPDLDIVDLPFDDYVSKPVDREGLRAVIDRLRSIDQYDRRMGELYAVGRTLATLEADTPGRRLEEDERYRELRERQAELEAEMRGIVGSLDADELSRLFEVAVDDAGSTDIDGSDEDGE